MASSKEEDIRALLPDAALVRAIDREAAREVTRKTVENPAFARELERLREHAGDDPLADSMESLLPLPVPESEEVVHVPPTSLPPEIVHKTFEMDAVNVDVPVYPSQQAITVRELKAPPPRSGSTIPDARRRRTQKRHQWLVTAAIAMLAAMGFLLFQRGREEASARGLAPVVDSAVATPVPSALGVVVPAMAPTPSADPTPPSTPPLVPEVASATSPSKKGLGPHPKQVTAHPRDPERSAPAPVPPPPALPAPSVLPDALDPLNPPGGKRTFRKANQ